MTKRKRQIPFSQYLEETDLPEEDKQQIRYYMEYRQYRYEAQQAKRPYLDARSWLRQVHPDSLADMENAP